MATNPRLAGISGAAGPIEGRSVVALEQTSVVTLPYAAPWQSFSELHLLVDAWVIRLTERALHRATA